MGNVKGITKNIPNLQVYKHTPATPTTLSIKVVIVVPSNNIVPVCMLRYITNLKFIGRTQNNRRVLLSYFFNLGPFIPNREGTCYI